MKIGLMWFDGDAKRSFEDKIKIASKYYLDKYGHNPTEVWVCKKQLEEEYVLDGMLIKPSLSIIMNNFWLGVK